MMATYMFQNVNDCRYHIQTVETIEDDHHDCSICALLFDGCRYHIQTVETIDDDHRDCSIVALLYVVKLNLSTSRLNGTLTNFTFSSFTSLTHLELRRNDIFGSIPAEIMYLSKLVFLDLSGNHFSRTIPQEIGMLVNLETLSFHSNNLEGHIPVSFGNLTNLGYLRVDDNKLSGYIPREVGNLENLVKVNMSFNFLTGHVPFCHNELSGQIPISIGNLSKLEQLYLNNNQFNGSILKQLGNLKSLVELILLINRLSGPIPDSLCNLRKLEKFTLQNNKLSGYFPETIGKCTKLRNLVLSDNSIMGSVPESVCNLISLEILHLGNNQLSGSIPGISINCRNLEVLDLGDNKLSGGFPYWIDTRPEKQVLILRGNKLNGTLHTSNTKTPFPKLRILDLSRNQFASLLPSNYFNNFKAMMSIDRAASGELYMSENYMYDDTVVLVVKELSLELERILVVYTTIDLSVNKFEGEIPDTTGQLRLLQFLNLSHNSDIRVQLASLTFLAVVNFSHNQLQGAIPKRGQFNMFGNSSFQGNSGLCGFRLAKNCGDDRVTFSLVPEEHEDDTIFDGFSWQSVVMGYGFGMLIGLGIGWVTFHLRTPRLYNMIAQEPIQNRK
ncbi:hypothetical protein L1987_63902 [Smallanthus sonchifolius]|uniref:Uncharacterized protein n=1 Tax=Smallanthus sonchifolius TaxID=185202 RepID=A0ACB9CEV0_9ASTR|nr:hypothetical protein L1987_63902 [Smallanthus sonchifolius]